MTPFQSLAHLLGRLWSGPQALAGVPQLALEWRFVMVRWLGILVVAPVLPFANLSADRMAGAFLVLVLAAAYNGTIQTMLVRGRALSIIGYVTTTGDTLLNIAIITVGGGFDTPFAYLLFTITVGSAMRYGFAPSIAMWALVTIVNVLVVVAQGRPLDAQFGMLSGCLFMTALLASYLREQARRAEAALQERLRQANLLNEANALPAVSLDLERVLQAVAAAGAHLFGSPYAVLQPSAELASDDSETMSAVIHRHVQDDHLEKELSALCMRYATDGETALPEALVRESLPSGRHAVALSLVLPSRQKPVATMALALAPGSSAPMLDDDVVDSFVERTSLAVENAALYRRLAGRSAELQRAFADLAMAHQELLGVDEMKTNFLANVSHELRTPLSSIRAFSELLLSYEDDTVTQREFIAIINSESERLTRLVNDVLDISKIEAGRMDWNMADLDLRAVLHDTSRTYQPLIAQHGLSFVEKVDPNLPRIFGDRDRLQQVLGNLFNNAVKFTSTGTIRLSAEQVGDEVHISLSDSGMGIPEEEQGRIFEKFQQVGAMLTDKPRGTGLGLAICREIIAHHSGRIWVESTVGVGSTFRFSLPVVASAVEIPSEDRSGTMLVGQAG